MELEVKLLCASNEAVDEAAAMLETAGFADFKKFGNNAAYDAALLVEVDDDQMDAAPMGGAHIISAVVEAIMCVCDGAVVSLHAERRESILPWNWRLFGV